MCKSDKWCLRVSPYEVILKNFPLIAWNVLPLPIMVSAAPHNLCTSTQRDRKLFSASRTDGATWSMDHADAKEQGPSWYANCYLSSQKISWILGNSRFITLFTRAHHQPISWARLFQFIFSRTFSLRHVLVFSYHLFFSLPSGLFYSGFPTKILYVFLIVTEYATCPTVSFYKCRVKSTNCDTHHYVIFPIHLFQIFKKSILIYPQSRLFLQGERPRCSPIQNVGHQIFWNEWLLAFPSFNLVWPLYRN